MAPALLHRAASAVPPSTGSAGAPWGSERGEVRDQVLEVRVVAILDQLFSVAKGHEALDKALYDVALGSRMLWMR